ncbi:hypothetical protein QBC32DRAFT_318369 [Pseudoneurospora amorphoporcata]|uniref:Uncharacterized protein n=1 Tax=Pseudoneurospora amorphoporcata TaxID=241081 RepID=A0AAN6SBU2_9PEZI|nr:hypothetical protein QBC32DRAFT_318369 [Pseudoneurospora amorphoporcata]
MSHGHSTLSLTKLLKSRTAWTQALLYSWMPQVTRPYSLSTLSISLEIAGGLLRGARRPPAATPTSAELLAAGTAYPNFSRCHRAREPTTEVPKTLKDHHKTILIILGTTIANQARSKVPR